MNPLTEPVVLAATSWSAAQFKFSITGPIGLDYIVQASSELTSWACLSTNTPGVVPFSFTDTNAAGFGWRYYRVLLGP